MIDFCNNFVCKIFISAADKKLGENQSPYVALALDINIQISGKDRVSFPFFEGVKF